ncbi:MAG: saccharopine dehydrogenase C-terminal domain-containing protein [Candidatus Pacearchaeota archaeon]
MRYDFVVLGATGIQGRIVTRDLLENNYSVLMCGRDKSRILKFLKEYKKTNFEYVEAREIEKMSEIIKNSGSKIVINCMEGDWNLNALKACIKADANYIDLGSEIWMTKKQLKLDKLLKRKNLISITGIGSVPGIGNIMLRYISEKFDTISDIEVGFSWNSNLKKFVVPFSIESVLEEFKQPAPILKNGKFEFKKPLDNIREKYHREIGKQKEFLVKHPEQYTFFKYFKNKGIKNIKFYAGFPEHSFKTICTLIEIGMDSKEPINFFGSKIKPIDFLKETLKRIEIPKGYKEKENLWLKVKGKQNKKNKTALMECIVTTLKGWEDAGCNVDTGMPASILAQMIKKRIITEKGSFSPEAVVPPEPFFQELRKRKMIVLENGKIIN